MNSCLSSSTKQPLDCIGQGVKACRAELQHDSNAGMTNCINDELMFWMKQLDIAQDDQLAQAAEFETAEFETSRVELGAPKVPLIDMTQEAYKTWVNHRDAACQVEVGYWAGGTGGASVFARCKLEMTARQAVKLMNGGWGIRQ